MWGVGYGVLQMRHGWDEWECKTWGKGNVMRRMRGDGILDIRGGKEHDENGGELFSRNHSS